MFIETAVGTIKPIKTFDDYEEGLVHFLLLSQLDTDRESLQLLNVLLAEFQFRNHEEFEDWVPSLNTLRVMQGEQRGIYRAVVRPILLWICYAIGLVIGAAVWIACIIGMGYILGATLIALSS